LKLDAEPSPYALGPSRRGAGNRAAMRRRFRLGEDDVVSAVEIECALPGCPPLETVIAFWMADEKRRHYKIFKPIVDVVEDDLPPSWMRDALIVEEGFECSCC
jgi:nitrate reductase delta subunit